jgi:N-acetylneuraminic acid mutarotase
MLEAALGKKTPNITPGVLLGIYEAQPIITTGDYNFYNAAGAYVRVGDYLYLAVGSVSSGGSYNLASTLYRYDLKTFTVTTLANIPKAVSFSSIVHDNGKLYLFGGVPASGVTTAYLCIYDIATAKWTNTAKFSYLRKNSRTFVYNNRLYAVGGGLSSGAVYYEIISCSLDDYSVINHGNFLNQAGAGYLQNEGQGVLIGSKFYFSRGGSISSNSWMVYDAALNTLTVLTPNPNSIQGESPVLFGDKIAVRNSNTSFSLYDPKTDTWSIVTAQTNASQATNAQCAHFEYDGSLWFKYLQTNDTTARRFWRIY